MYPGEENENRCKQVSWLLQSDRGAEGGQVGDSGGKGSFGITTLQFGFHLSPYQSRGAAYLGLPFLPARKRTV